MTRLKLALQAVALFGTYGLACSDLHELLSFPQRWPTVAVNASTLPPASSAPGALSPQQVSSVIRSLVPTLQTNCGQLDAQPILAHISIEPNGEVRRVQSGTGASRGSDKLAGCVVAALGTLTFADGSAGTEINVQIDLLEPDPARAVRAL